MGTRDVLDRRANVVVFPVRASVVVGDMADRVDRRYRVNPRGITLRYGPIRRPRSAPSFPYAAITCVILGGIMGFLFLAVLGHFGVPIVASVFLYLMAISSAYLVTAGFMRVDE
jgi:hypothetical protein